MKRALLCAALVLSVGCGATLGPIPAPSEGAVEVDPAAALAFQVRADAFYQRLVRRRFNALETFNDRFLRKHFRTEDAFFDYYSELATALDDAHFERSQPESTLVVDFLFGEVTSALVQVRYVGNDDRPLRPNNVYLDRIDRWDWKDDNWWITPGAAWK